MVTWGKVLTVEWVMEKVHVFLFLVKASGLLPGAILGMKPTFED